MSQENSNSNENVNIPEQDESAEERAQTETAEARESAEERAQTETAEARESAEEAPRQPRRVSLTAFICTCISLVLVAVMLTYTLCTAAYWARISEIRQKNALTGAVSDNELADELSLLEKIFSAYSFEELDGEALRTAVLKAYVNATGDRYAQFYTLDEYAALLSDMGGESQGIGINVIDSEVEVLGVTYKAFKVINIVKDSPAERNGLHFGDYIVAVGTSDENTTVGALGYDMALKELQGVKGTYAEFVVYRPSIGESMEFSILRDAFVATSVMYTRAESAVGEGIGVVKILEFDLTTPTQLDTAIEELKAQGCGKFVFDVRYNPGGELSSIVACLSRFLDEGDTVISVKDKAGNGELTRVKPVTSTSGCSVSAEDIGKYKDLNMVVLCNESTASAAELFTANFRDHGLGEIVGTKTYGKGSMQTYINLAYYGCDGVLKITKDMYYPPCGVSYDGIGIEPKPECTVEPSEEAGKANIYDIMGTVTDNQLTEAVKYFK